MLEKIKSNRKLVIVGTIAVLAVIAVPIVIILNYRNNGENNDDQNQSTVNPLLESYNQKLPELKSKVDTNPSDASARREYAVALYAVGNVEAAKEQYLAEAGINPNDAILQNNLGNTYRDSGQYQEAITAYQKSIDIASSQTTAYINLANLYIYTLGESDLGIGVYKNALSKVETGNKETILVSLASGYEQSGDIENARKTYDEVLKINPSNTAATAGLNRLQ